jgi:uncharacterized protein (TIGR03503 family)
MVKKSVILRLVILFISFFLSAAIVAQTTKNNSQKIDYIKGDNITNAVPYFDNRFRLDAQLDEITILFYRKSGSVPVILVRPDGSKLRINKYDKTKVEWYDDLTFDMIKIKKPMPGPWQVIGDILVKSQILVISDVKIEVEPLPEVMLAGETLKMKGKLLNGDLAINNPKFRNVVQLDVEFISTNNASYENFGTDVVELTSFRDDGLELDEYANDGVFTGEFQLTIPSGEWVPLYRIKLPMATRELRQQPIVLRKNPISMSVETASYEGEFHKVHFIIDPRYVDPDSFIFQGKITYPDRQDEPFSLTEGQGIERIKQFGYTEPGVHRLNVNAFGRTVNGREFRLIVPEFTFNVEVVEAKLPEGDESNNSEDKAVNENSNSTELTSVSETNELSLAEISEQQIEQDKKAQQMQWLIIGAGNLIIIIIGLGGFFFMRKRKAKK